VPRNSRTRPFVSAVWRRWRRGLFRVVAVCACVAVCVAVLAGAPARAATAGKASAALPAVPLPINPGGNFTFSVPFTGGTTAAANQVLTGVMPTEFGFPAEPTLSEEVTSVFNDEAAAAEDAGATVTAPPSFPDGTTTVTASGVTTTVPAASIPQNSPANPSGPLAAFLGALITFTVTQAALVMCSFSVGAMLKLQPSQSLSAGYNTTCATVSAAIGALALAAVNFTWWGAKLLGDEAAAIITASASASLFGGLTAVLAPTFTQSVAVLGGKFSGWLPGALAAVTAWIPSWSTVASFFTGMWQQVSSVSVTGWNAIMVALGLPTVRATGAFSSLAGSLCADAYGAGGLPVIQQSVTVNNCNGTADQYWVVWSNGTVTNGGLCLTVSGSTPNTNYNPWRPANPLNLYTCGGSNYQQWNETYTSYGSGSIYNPLSGFCIDDPNGNSNPGSPLYTGLCYGDSYDAWALPGSGATGTGTFPSVTGYGPMDPAGECADAYGTTDGASAGQIVAVNACDSDLAQDWTVWSDGTIRAWNLCMDTTGGTQLYLGTPLVDLEPCDGDASQQWTPLSDGALENNGSGTCLDDPFDDTSPGVELDVFPCNGSVAQQWTLPGMPASPPAGSSVCDIYESYGTPCAAAYSMTRALYSAYDGPLYQVTRASDGTTANIGLLSAGGDVDASQQDSFCASTTCTITEIYDQSPDGNNLTIEGAGGEGTTADQGANAAALPITIGGNEAYGLDITPGTGYRDDGPGDAGATGVATNGEPEGMYMVASGTNVNIGCCFDFGNAETDNHDNGAGHMDAVNLTTFCGPYVSPCAGSGPWVEADMENGQWTGDGSNPDDTSSGSDFVTAMLSNDGQSTFELQGGNAQSGGLTTFYDGSLPSAYIPMHQEGGIVLGTGGDNSNSDTGSFFEGVMTEGFPTAAADAAVQANIVAADYSGNSSPSAPVTTATPSAAGQAVVHSTGATGAGAAGYSSVYTVDSANGDLQESYLPYMGDSWTSQNLSDTGGDLPGTPPVMPGTQPVAITHCGYTSVYTVDASSGDLQETYLPAIGGPWTTQDLSANYGTPPTNVTPTAVEHYAGASGTSAGCGYTSVYTRDRNGDLEETYLPNTGFPGDAWYHQDLSENYGTPQILAGTSPVAVVHCGYTSVYTVDGNGDLEETYLPAIGGPWYYQDLSGTGGLLPGTPPTDATPTAVVHSAGATGAAATCGFTSVYTVDRGSNDLEETYLPIIGGGWTAQNLSANYGTPPVAPGTSPVALVHMGYTSVYTVDEVSDQLEETYLPEIGDAWGFQSLSANYQTPETDQTPIVLLHPDTSGVLDWVSVYTVAEFNSHLDETYLSNVGFPGDGWVYQDLSDTGGSLPGTPPVYQLQSSPASWSVAHTGFTSTYTVDASSGDLEESYLPAMGDGWTYQDLSDAGGDLPGTPDVAAHSTPVALVHDGYTSVYTVDRVSGDLQETYLPYIGDKWSTQPLPAPPVSIGTSPTAVFHDGYVSVYTVNQGTGDLEETYLPAAGFPGDAWVTQNLSDTGGSLPGTPPVMAGTSPVAIVHDGYVSVYTVDQNGDLQETFLPFMGDDWSTQDLSANYNVPKTEVTPTAVFHDGYTSVYTVDWNGDLEESYLPWMGDGWSTQDLTANYNVPQAINVAPAALYHDGYTSVYYLTGPDDHLVEAYLPAIGGPWGWQDLSANYQTPASVQSPSPLVHYDTNGALTWTSVYTIDASFTTDSDTGDLQETYLPDAGFPGDAWVSQDLSANYQTPDATGPGSVMYSAPSTISGLGYARVIQLHYGGDQGDLLGTFEDSNNDGSITSYTIQKSTDDGATWSTLTTVPADVDAYAPVLFEFPEQLGNYPAGTIMLLGTTFDAGSQNIAIREWISTDEGSDWNYMGIVQQGGGLGDGVYEPFLFIDSLGELAMVFSDERQNSTYSQFIGEIVSPDGGVSWSAEQNGSTFFGPGETQVIASPWQADRPGMATVTQLSDGEYVLSYEMCGPHNCAVYTKTSTDGDNWGSGSSDFGTQAETASGLFLQESPVITSVGNTLYLTAHNDVNANGGPIPEDQTVVLTNTDGGQGSWSWIAAPPIPNITANPYCHINYSPDILPTANDSGLLYTAPAASGPEGCQEVTDLVPIAP
jgi:hypothetical protein